jgi:hypothetical protein
VSTPCVHGIYTAPDQCVPMIPSVCIRAIAGVGLEGDRYALGKGSWKSDDGTHKPKRRISLISIEAIRAARIFTPEETRRNIVTQGIDLAILIGKDFRIGSEVVLRGVEPATPCNHPSHLVHKPSFEEAFRGQGGLLAEILEGGILTLGHEITLVQLNAA